MPSPTHDSRSSSRIGRRLLIVGLLIGLGLVIAWGVRQQNGGDKAPRTAPPVPVKTARVSARDLPVRLTLSGTVRAQRSVAVHAQVQATVRTVHVREGQFVAVGERLFSLDVRAEAAAHERALAQAQKSRSDLANAERSLRRSRELFAQKFIAQTALDAAQSQVDSLRAQLAADSAAAEQSHVARDYGQIRAPIAGRTGVVTVVPGSLVQPGGAALLSIAQMDPVDVVFAVPERELPALGAAARGTLAVVAQLEPGGGETAQTRTGTLSFIDNGIDSGSGTILAKARFANADLRLWPGMFVTVTFSPRTLAGALTVPAQAVHESPDGQFVYGVDADGMVTARPVRVTLIQDGIAALDGVAADLRVVVEGAPGLRPGARVVERAADEVEVNAEATDQAAADKATPARRNAATRP